MLKLCLLSRLTVSRVPWCREQALLTARYEPVLSRDRVYERIRYPNVYDNLAEATKTAAFVGGARVRLCFTVLHSLPLMCDMTHRFKVRMLCASFFLFLLFWRKVKSFICAAGIIPS